MDPYLETLFQQHQRYKDTRPNFIPPELPRIGKTCSTATNKRGQRGHRMVTAFGETLPLYLMARKHNMAPTLLRERLNKAGSDHGKAAEDALTKPLGIGRPKKNAMGRNW